MGIYTNKYGTQKKSVGWLLPLDLIDEVTKLAQADERSPGVVATLLLREALENRSNGNL